MAPEAKYLAWIDLETTGTDERHDSIIEAALIVTTPQLEEVHAAAFHNWVIFPTAEGKQRLMENDYVREMHQTNGLLDDINNLTDTPVWDIGSAESEIIAALYSYGARRHEVMLAGSGVSHFDRRFLKAQMSGLERWFQYANLDVGVVRRFLEMVDRNDWVPTFNQDKNHRAADDIQLHLAEARHYQGLFRAAQMPIRPKTGWALP